MAALFTVLDFFPEKIPEEKIFSHFVLISETEKEHVRQTSAERICRNLESVMSTNFINELHDHTLMI